MDQQCQRRWQAPRAARLGQWVGALTVHAQAMFRGRFARTGPRGPRQRVAIGP
jgi:hypothetical protein